MDALLPAGNNGGIADEGYRASKYSAMAKESTSNVGLPPCSAGGS